MPGSSASPLFVEVRNPLLPEPYLGEPLLVQRILAEVRLHEPLEQAALPGFGLRDGTDVIEGVLESGGAHGGLGVSAEPVRPRMCPTGGMRLTLGVDRVPEEATMPET